MFLRSILVAFVATTTFSEAYYIVKEPSITLHEIPEEYSVLEDIIPYGTKLEITDEKDSWVHVTYADWHGWTLKSNLYETSRDFEKEADLWVGYRGAYIYKENDTTRGPILQLPFETSLKLVKELPDANKRWLIVEIQDGSHVYIQRSQVVFSKKILNVAETVNLSKLFLGTKYLWGGTTSFGYDCSGFVKMLYRQMGITLPRNSKEQAVDPQFETVAEHEAQAGDLVFLKNSSHVVVHVGMMINNKDFIHSFTKDEAWICISSLYDVRCCNGNFYHGTIIRRYNP